MPLPPAGDPAVADGITSRLDTLSAREVLLSALRRVPGPLQLEREQSRREAKSAPPAVSGGVAVWAHIGGFIAGAALIKVFENPRLVVERNAIRQQQLWTTA